MKGLLIKDLKLIMTQKSFIVIVGGVCGYLLVTGKVAFGMAYAAVILAMLVTSTVNYDDHDNGMGFLFTLPISRKIYVMEKYLLGIILTAAVLAVGSAAMFMTVSVKPLSYTPQEWFSAGVGSFLSASVLLSSILPLQMKFGAEKGRMAMAVGVICIGVIIYSIQQVVKAASIDLQAFIEPFLHAGAVEVAAAFSILSAGMLAISCAISIAIMKRKQF